MSSLLGGLLVVDLAARTAKIVPLDPSVCRRFLGGVGLATRLLWDYSEPGCDPLGPENAMVFAAGPLTGTMAPSASKYAIATSSPLTGFIGDSISSGGWPLALKRAGYDAMVVLGAAEIPTYLFIDDDRVYFRPARRLWGAKSWETEEGIRRELGDDSVSVATIGPAGERLVRYACVSNDYGRQAGRTGPGAVMGSKKLKAIAVRGTKPIHVADAETLRKTSLDLYARAQGAATTKYRVLGTPANVLALNALAALPAFNFRQSTFDGAEAVSGERLYERYKAKVVACGGCPIACDHIYRVTDGTYAGTQAAMDYESLYALGPLCGIDDPEAILKATELCDQYGLDTMSTGASIAWAMECFERGLVAREEVEGLELRFGNGEAVEAAELFRAATGLDMTAEELQKAGERVCNPRKAYNIREGWTRADDTLPPRILEEPLPTGIARGTALTREELSTMIDGYYEARGWTPEGLIPPEKLEERDLSDLRGRVGDDATVGSVRPGDLHGVPPV